MLGYAIAWAEQRGIYDYRGHQVRTKSILPDTVKNVGALDNFKYVLDRQAKLKGPQLQLPWEFLVHVVNHRTSNDAALVEQNLARVKAGKK